MNLNLSKMLCLSITGYSYDNDHQISAKADLFDNEEQLKQELEEILGKNVFISGNVIKSSDDEYLLSITSWQLHNLQNKLAQSLNIKIDFESLKVSIASHPNSIYQERKANETQPLLVQTDATTSDTCSCLIL